MANFLAEAAGPLPHEGGLKSESIRVLASTLKMALKDRGIALESLPDSNVLDEVLDGLRNRPDRTAPREERWDTDRLIEFWEGEPDNDELSLERLRAKTISLLMLLGLARPSDLERLDAETFSASREAVSVRSFTSKNSGNSYDDPIVLPFLPQKQRRSCGARALKAYMEATADARVDSALSSVGVRPVFLHLSKPEALSAERISKVAKGVLTEIGVPFRTYSTRSNAATRAIERGVDPVVVQKAGRWRSSETMNKFYVRGLSTSGVAHALAKVRAKARARPDARR